MSETTVGDPPRIRVALVNDYEIVLRGIESMLQPYRDRIEVVELDVESNPDQFVDVALFDTYGHARLGLDRISSLSHDAHVGAVAVYTWSCTPERFNAARSAGARSVLAKSMSADALVEALQQIAREEDVVNVHFGRSVRQPWPGHDLGLTLRESEVALFLAQGMRNRDIASALWVSENTVKTHLKSIFQKTSASSRAEAIVRISRDASFSPKRHEHRAPLDPAKRPVEPAKRSLGGTHPKR